MLNLERYQKLKIEVDRLQRDRDRAEGALAQLMGRLKDEFGCDTLEKAEAELTKLRKKKEKAEREFNEALAEFDEKWGEKLSG